MKILLGEPVNIKKKYFAKGIVNTFVLEIKNLNLIELKLNIFLEPQFPMNL